MKPWLGDGAVADLSRQPPWWVSRAQGG